MNTGLVALNAAAGDLVTQADTERDFFDDLTDLIDLIGADYLKIYEELIQKYSDLFTEFNEKIMAKMGDWIKGVNDGKEIDFDLGEIKNELTALIAKFKSTTIFPLAPAVGASLAEVNKWKEALGLPDACVVLASTNPISYKLVMDSSPLQTMLDSLPLGNSVVPIPPAPWPPHTVRWDSAKFQAWQTGFNTQESELKNKLQMLTSKYSSANAYHDNFNKILSSQLSQFADMLKAYANF